jgi:SAM-dependent methyltransferase
VESNLSCDLCGNLDTELYLTKVSNENGQESFDLVRCRRCGLIYLDPRPTTDEIGRYYVANSYYAYQRPDDKQARIVKRLKRLAYQAKCQHPDHSRSDRWPEQVARYVAGAALGWRVRRRVPVQHQGRLLDVGCGNGEWLAWIRDNIGGWDVEGLEVNQEVAERVSSSLNLTVHVGPLDKTSLPTARYDAITMWHSLEHTHSPSRVLKEAYRLLRPDGCLALEVPNIASYEARILGRRWYHLDVPRHLYHFTPTTLRKLLTTCGFRVVRLKPMRNHVAWNSAVRNEMSHLPGPICLVALAVAGTLGRLSTWAIRVYAIKS